MKKFFKYLLVIIFIVIAGVIAYTFLKPTAKKDIFNYVPKDAAMMVYTKNGTNNWEKIRKSEGWKILENQELFKPVEKSMHKADSLIGENKMAARLLKERAVLVSLHPSNKEKLKPIIFIDLEKLSNLSFSLDLLQSKLLEKINYRGERIDYHDRKIFRIVDLKKDQEFYLTLVEHVLVLSPQLNMIKHCLDSSQNYWLNQKSFKKLTEDFKGQGNLQLFLNFKTLKPYVIEYFKDQEEFADWSNSLQYAGFKMELDDNKLIFDGLISNADSVAGYINAFEGINPGKSNAHKWLTQKTASYVSLRFDQFNALNQQFLEQLAALDSKAYQQYISQTRTMEDKFEIDTRDHIFNWINNEVVVGKMRPQIGVGRAEDFFIGFHTSNIETAKTMLGVITGSISSSTPLKFRTRDYKEHEIHHLDLKGFFKIFAGNIFQKIDRPYFTFIEDFVVFSNSAGNLKTIIEDYYEKNVLNENKSYKRMQDLMEANSNINIYLKTSQMYSTLYYFSNFSGQQQMEKYRDLLLSIEDIGISIKPGKDFLQTKAAIQLNSEVEDDPIVSMYENEVSNPANDLIETLEFRFNPESFNIPKDTSGLIEIFYPDNKIWYRGKMKDGKLNGLWRTYYNSGNIKSSVIYTDNKVTKNAVFFYDNPGNTIHIKVRFEENKIVDEYLEYYENGRLKTKIEYQDGVENGEGEFYYPNGRIMKEGRFDDGNKQGTWKYYDRKGDLVRKKRY